ncbi:MAG: peptidase M28, partial [Gemmatimonadota bacterium]
RALADEYIATRYHKPSDDIKADWDLSGGVEDVQVLFEVGWLVLQGPTWPEWKPGTEFKSIREAMLAR